MLGKTLDETATLLAKDMHISLNQSRRLVRTETMRYLSNENLRDMYERGYTQVQEVVTIDERTSSECATHQAQIHPIENAPELPRHPNCRCCLIPVIGTRLSRKEAEERLNTGSMNEFYDTITTNWENINELPMFDTKFELIPHLNEMGFKDKYVAGNSPNVLQSYGINEKIYLSKSDLAYFLNHHKNQIGLEHYKKMDFLLSNFDIIYESGKSNQIDSFGTITQVGDGGALELGFGRNPYDNKQYVVHFQYIGRKKYHKQVKKINNKKIIIDKK